MGTNMNRFKNAKMVLEDAKKQEQVADRASTIKCDWDDPHDVQVIRATKNLQKRLRTLNRLVPKRICPVCQRVVMSHRRWVILRGGSKAVCLSCYKKPRRSKVEKSRTIQISVFGTEQVRYEFNSDRLTEARESAGLNYREFAQLAGWSRPYQVKLESGQVDSVTLATAETIVRVLREAGLETLDRL